MSIMSRMSRNILTLLMIVLVSRPGWSIADEPSEMLARAETLYYEADFAKSVELLLRADELLREATGHPREKTDVKLQLALGFLGLNDSTRAKAYLLELYAMDSDHYIDPQLFSPKVIRLAEEAKAEQNEQRCRYLMDEAQQHLGTGNTDAALKLIGTGQAKCSGLAALHPKAAELVFKEGLAAYKNAQMTEALRKFRAAVGLQPKHELAAQYADLTESKLEVASDRALLAWRRDFTAGEFASAARDYRELTSVSRSQTIDEVRAEYRQALSNLVDAWNRACMDDNTAAMEEIRLQVNALLPETSFGEDILAKMTTCTHTRCIQMSTELVLARLKSRVNPEFPASVLSQVRVSPVVVRIKATINEKGEIAASEMLGGNPLLYSGVRAAFEQWKFVPAVVQNESRCVDTEIPIVINFTRN